MNFTMEQYEGKQFFTYLLSENEATDPLLMGMLLNNRIQGFAAFSVKEEGETKRLCYDVDGLRSMQEIFEETVSRHTLLNSFDKLLSVLASAQDYMIDASAVLLDPQYIFMDPDSFRMALICLPLEAQSESNEKDFFKSVMFHSTFDYNEPCEHVARIMNYLNGSEFDSNSFRALLAELGAGETAEAFVAEPDPFFDLTVSEEAPAEPVTAEPAEQKEEDPFADWFTPKKEEKTEKKVEDDPFADWFTPKKEEKVEKKVEDDPFADWFTPKKEEKVEKKVEDDPFADWFAPKTEKKTETALDEFTTPIVSSRKKTAVEKPAEKESAPAELDFDFFGVEKKPATEAMKLADDLLSAALAATPAEEPKQEEPSLDFDFFAAPETKKSAARLEAEAILDALDLSAPAAEEEPKPETKEKPAEAQEEPARKGGFFSKLRKKEEAPKESAPSVVPYFGSDGETTILNVAQQTKPSAPYLLRSSNQETVVLSKPVFRIGKDKDFSDYCIQDNSAISRRHANIMLRNGDVFIVDNNSTNHTYVNGAMIRSNAEIKLTHGDEIRLANEDFMLYCAGTV